MNKHEQENLNARLRARALNLPEPAITRVWIDGEIRDGARVSIHSAPPDPGFEDSSSEWFSAENVKFLGDRLEAQAERLTKVVAQRNRYWEQVEVLSEALRELLACSRCQNGCAPDDMACATNKADAALTEEALMKPPTKARRAFAKSYSWDEKPTTKGKSK